MTRKCTICLHPLKLLSFRWILLYVPLLIHTRKHIKTRILDSDHTYIDVSISLKQNSTIRLKRIYKIC